MGLASPFQSSKPLEYWIGGLLTTDLVNLWTYLHNAEWTQSYPSAKSQGNTYIVNPCLLTSMSELTEEASGPDARWKAGCGSVNSDIEGQGIPNISDPLPAALASWCYIPDAPALCDWAFPLGCLMDYSRCL